MKRKMIGIAAAYMSGLFFASFFTKVSDLITAVGIFAVIVLIGRYKGMKQEDFGLIALVFSLAFAVEMFYTGMVYGRITAYDGIEGSYSGTVEEVRHYNGDKASYVLKGKINGVQSAKITFFGNALDVGYGDRINIESCKFFVPSGDYLFDVENYYRSEKIFLSAESIKSVACENLHKRRLKNFLMDYREKIISDFRIKLGSDCGGFLSGMVFGEKSSLDDDIKTSLYRSGIGHVLAVSGLHVSIVAAAVMWFMRKIRVNKFAAFVIMNGVMLMMIIMANSPVSAIRAAVMLDMIHSARLFRRQNDTFNSLAIAVLIICISNPYAIHSAGFLLSVAGTFGIGVFAPYMTRNIPDNKIYSGFIGSFLSLLCTTLVIMPVSMLYFEETSLISPVVNVLLVPLCSAAMLIGMIYAATGGILPILNMAGVLIKTVLFITDKLSSLRFAYFSCGSDIPAKIGLICIIIVVLIKLFTENHRYIALSAALSFCIVMLSSAIYENYRYNRFTVAVLGKGNRASAVICYHGITSIIDLNGNYKTPEYAGRYIRKNAVHTIEFISLSESVQSKYPIYISESGTIPVGKWLISGSTEIYKLENCVYFGENGWLMHNNDYTAEYMDGVLTVKFGASELIFVSTKTEAPQTDGLVVHYGNLTKNDEMICDGRNIYLDSKNDIMYEYSGMINFETELSEIGRYKINTL